MNQILEIIYKDKFANMSDEELADYCRKNFGIFSDYSEKLFKEDKHRQYLSCVFTPILAIDTVKASFVRTEIIRRLAFLSTK